jgi:WD40 repeat protein
MRTLRGHRGMVLTCALTDDARYGISGSEDMTVRLWDLQQSRLLFTFATASAVEACDIAANGSVAIAGETSGRVHLFAVHT